MMSSGLQTSLPTPKQIRHDAHKEHPLSLCNTGVTFRCDGCLCDGAGLRYRCAACDFDLHEFCATCPPAAPLFAFHGHHHLTLEPAAGERRCCDLCSTPIRGTHYSCRPCDLAVHPVCSQLPGSAVSPLHPEHLVVLALGAPGGCSHCRGACLWRYRCVPCKVDLNPKCLFGTTAHSTPLGIPKEDVHHTQTSSRPRMTSTPFFRG